MTVELTYRKVGDGKEKPPLVILHGLLGSAGNWRSVARGLEQGRSIYCLNLRNHGDSPHCEGMCYEDMAEDVRAFIVREGLEMPDIIGHSMGGKAAMMLALKHPGLIRKLVVVDIAPVTYAAKSFPMFDAMRQVELERVSRREDADQQLQAHLPDAMLRAFVLTNLRRGPDGYSWRVNVDAITAGLPDILGFPDAGVNASPVSALFLGGAQSDYLTGHEAAISRLFSNATIQMIDGAGHWPHADRLDETVSMISDFLENQERYE